MSEVVYNVFYLPPGNYGNRYLRSARDLVRQQSPTDMLVVSSNSIYLVQLAGLKRHHSWPDFNEPYLLAALKEHEKLRRRRLDQGKSSKSVAVLTDTVYDEAVGIIRKNSRIIMGGFVDLRVVEHRPAGGYNGGTGSLQGTLPEDDPSGLVQALIAGRNKNGRPDLEDITFGSLFKS